MPLLLILVLLLVEVWTGRITSNDTQCCYLYGSAPHSNRNCVPSGEPLSLQYIIFNPHDSFTNMTVRWYRNGDMTRASSSTNELDSTTNGDYLLLPYPAAVETDLRFQNCKHGAFYRDTFLLQIHNFTSINDGYYWCQIVVNNSILQASQYAWFYADDRNTCTQGLIHFSPSDPYCAEYQTNMHTTSLTNSVAITGHLRSSIPPISSNVKLTSFITVTVSISASKIPATTASMIPTITTTDSVSSTLASEMTTKTGKDSEPIFYVTGLLGMLVLLLATLATMLMIYICKRQKEHKQKCEKTRQREETAHATDNGSNINLDTAAIQPRVLNTLLHESDTNAQDDIYSVVSETSLNNTIPAMVCTDTQQEHTYDLAEFHSQTNSSEQPQYNTLQHGKTASAENICNPIVDAYNKIDINTSKDVQQCSKLSTQLQRGNYSIDSEHEYDGVETSYAQRENQSQTYEDEIDRTHQATPGPLDYEPVYYGYNSTQVEDSTSKHALIDGETYDTHKQVSKKVSVQQGRGIVKPTSQNIYSNTKKIVTALSKDMSTANKEVEYAEPQLPSTKIHAQEPQAKDEHQYYTIEQNEAIKAEECEDGVPYFASNNQQTTFAMPTVNHIRADAECRTQIPISFTAAGSTDALNEVGAINTPILLNIDQCEFDDPMYEVVSHLVPQSINGKSSSMSLDSVHEKSQMVCSVLSQEDVLYRDMNDDPEPLNHQDTENYANAPEYSDPVVSECVIDGMTSKHRDKEEEREVDTYDTFT